MTGAALLAVLATIAPAAPVRLRVTFHEYDGAPAQFATLSCRPSGDKATGYLREAGAARACRQARRREGMLTHVPDVSPRACDQTFGGPETARVTGRIGTRAVHRELARADGCEITEWNALVPLVPAHRDRGLTPSRSG